MVTTPEVISCVITGRKHVRKHAWCFHWYLCKEITDINTHENTEGYVRSWCVLFTVLLIIPLMILRIHVQILKFHETILRTAKMDEMIRLHD